MNQNHWLLNAEKLLAIVCIIFSLGATLKGQIFFIPIILLLVLNLINREKIRIRYEEKLQKITEFINKKVSVHQWENINNNYQEILTEINNLKEKQITLIMEDLLICQQEIENIQNRLFQMEKTKLNYLNKIVKKKEENEESNRYDLTILMSNKYQIYLMNIRKLLQPLAEGIENLESINQIKQRQIKLLIEELKINLSEVKQQQQQDFSYLNRQISNHQLTPQNYVEVIPNNSSENINSENINNDIINLENSFRQSIKEFEQNYLNQSDILAELENKFNFLEQQQDDFFAQIDTLYIQQTQKIDTLENKFSKQIIKITKQIDVLIESFNYHKISFETLLKNEVNHHTEAIADLYETLAKISKYLGNFEEENNNLQNINDFFNDQFDIRLTQFYNYQIKPLKEDYLKINQSLQEIIKT